VSDIRLVHKSLEGNRSVCIGMYLFSVQSSHQPVMYLCPTLDSEAELTLVSQMQCWFLLYSGSKASLKA